VQLKSEARNTKQKRMTKTSMIKTKTAEYSFFVLNFEIVSDLRFDGLVKSNETVMPDLIRHPEPLEITGFRLSPNDEKGHFLTFYEFVKNSCHKCTKNIFIIFFRALVP